MGNWREPSDEEMAERRARWEREAREPTPLPWRVVRGIQWNDKDELVAISGAPPNEDTVADNMEFYPHTIKAADAELIVHRVNVHDALVAALEFYAKRENWQTDWHEKNPCHDDAGKTAQAAVALARKGSS